MNTLPFALVNLGCSKNIVDGEGIAGHLQARGYILTDNQAAAEVIIINTCAFIQEAKQESIDMILSMAAFKKEGKCRKLIVCGCFAQRYHSEAARELPEVDHWVPLQNWREELNTILDLGSIIPPSPPQRALSATSFQYLKISEGCSHRCSFCVIPAIRGDFHSRPLTEIIDEARFLHTCGARECIVVSQDTSWYGRDIGSSLVNLLESLLKETAFPWIRMMYLHPAYIDDNLLRLVAAEPRIAPYFDMPLQHIADPILKAMRRAPDGAGLRALIERIRTLVPTAAIRTSLITGFPGETEAHFNELLAFVEESRFEKLGVFPYSPEEGTPASTMRPRPRDATARRRAETILELQRDISTEICAHRIGTTVPVIIDDPSDIPGYALVGRTRWDAPEVDGRVHIKEGSLSAGAIVNLPICDADAYDLFSPGLPD